MSLKHIDWKEPEVSKEIRRPFHVKIEESVARAFIKTVQSRGLFVREVVVKLMREFTDTYGEDIRGVRGSTSASPKPSEPNGGDSVPKK